MSITPARRRERAEAEPSERQYRAAAAEFAAEVTRAPGNRIWPSVTTLLDRFDAAMVTDELAERMTRALKESGLEIEPPLQQASRLGVVSLYQRAGQERRRTSHPSEYITVKQCRPGQRPVRVAPEPGKLGEDMHWIDVDVVPAHAPSVREFLAGLDPRPSDEMLDELLEPDSRPKLRRFDDSGIRYVSAAAVKGVSRPNASVSTKAGQLIVQPVELLASSRWLITAWHAPKIHSGVEEHFTVSTADSQRDLIVEEAEACWVEKPELSTAGDLGLAVLIAIAWTYPEARYWLYAWQDSWELDFRHYWSADDDEAQEVERETLVDLRGLVSLFHRSITPLDAPRDRAFTFWFSPVNENLAQQLATSVERSLVKLDEINNALRDDFNLAHLQSTRVQATRTGRLQSRFEWIAALLLVPTLVVSAYGANTELPGKDDELGLWIMLAGVLAAVALSAMLFRWMNRRDEAKATAAMRTEAE